MLAIESVSKSYGGTLVLDAVSFEVAEDEVVALVGPSGSGKSTLLRIVAGLEAADSGRVVLQGEDITSVAPEERGVGMVFQSLALFPHLDVAGNLAFGLPPGAPRGRIDEMLAFVGLEGFGERRIDNLSGGEAQRVALARSLIAEPRLLLLDEPLASLDADLKSALADEMRRLLQERGIPAIHVTHDRDLADRTADRVLRLTDL